MSDEITILKICTTCRQNKPHNEFRKQSKNKDGLKYTCKTCDDKRAKRRYQAKKTKIIGQVKEWQAANPDKVKFYKRRYRNKRTKIKS